MKEFYKTLISRDVLMHLAIMLAFAILVFVIVSVSLNNYTEHGTKMSVPDFTGLLPEKAEELASAKQLHIEVIDSVYSQKHPLGSIVAHTPAAGFNVKNGRTIYVTLNSVAPELVKMPNLLDISLRQAKEVLFVNGLKLGKISYAPHFAKNYVLAQNFDGKSMPKGEKIAKNSKIDLVLGLGSSDKEVLMPNLDGLSYERAIARIKAKSLVVGSELFPEGTETYDDSVKTLVYKQAPSFDEGKFVKIGTLVDIWLERDSALLDSLPVEGIVE